jgi:uncharacterized protein
MRTPRTARAARALLCVAALAVPASGCAGPSVTSGAAAAAPGLLGLPVPDVRQSTGYTCSAAALLAILAYFGEEEREDRLSRELGATPEAGAPPPAIVRVARAHGLTAELREGMTIAELERAVRAGTPVLVAIQAWAEKGGRDLAQSWDDGHYVIVVGFERDRILFEDPSLLGSRGELTRRELEARWHDTDGKHRYIRAGILFGGKRPAPPPPAQHID